MYVSWKLRGILPRSLSTNTRTKQVNIKFCDFIFFRFVITCSISFYLFIFNETEYITKQSKVPNRCFCRFHFIRMVKRSHTDICFKVTFSNYKNNNQNHIPIIFQENLSICIILSSSDLQLRSFMTKGFVALQKLRNPRFSC